MPDLQQNERTGIERLLSVGCLRTHPSTVSVGTLTQLLFVSSTGSNGRRGTTKCRPPGWRVWRCRHAGCGERLEYHLLANHLFANAKALVFAGMFFEGDEADEWLEKGLSILEKEIPEQVLPDGGHFERSPMYHSIILEDMLDLVNLMDGCEDAVAVSKVKFIADMTRSNIPSMTSWLQALSHPDGEIGFFNDTACGIASKPKALFSYALRLGLDCGSPPTDNLTNLQETGYIRYQQGQSVALMDVAPVGPNYQPGHAHADTLSFELSLFGQRLFVNSGTSTYEEGQERHRQRSTLAHNTVEINGENSSEVWKSFRVGRRAHPRNLKISEAAGRTVIICEHDGYRRLRGRPVHRRQWTFEPGCLSVCDEIDGQFNAAVASYHLHPDVTLKATNGADCLEIILPGGEVASFSYAGARIRVDEANWHPEFGLSVPTKVIRCQFDGPRLECRLSWFTE